MIKDYVKESFEPHILFSILCASVGIAAAYYYGHGQINATLAIIAVVGVMFAQLAVNLFDDYFDFTIGLDTETQKTKFSGGSVLLTGKRITPRGVLVLATFYLAIAFVIGVYILTLVHTLVLPLMIFGGIAVVFYARYLTHVPFLAEPLVGLSFALAGLGLFVVSASFDIAPFAVGATIVFLASGLQVGAALAVNEIPDRKPDKKYGRRSAVVMLETNAGAAAVYAAFYIVAYALVAYGIWAALIPIQFAAVFIMLIPNYFVMRGILGYKNPQSHEKTMALNAFATLAYILLLSILFVV